MSQHESLGYGWTRFDLGSDVDRTVVKRDDFIKSGILQYVEGDPIVLIGGWQGEWVTESMDTPWGSSGSNAYQVYTPNTGEKHLFISTITDEPAPIGNYIETGIMEGTTNYGTWITYVKFTTIDAIACTKLSVNMHTAAGNGRMALYTDNAGLPATLIVESGSQALSIGWNDFTVASTNLSASTSYWVAVQYSSTSAYVYWTVAASSSGRRQYYPTYGTFPATASPSDQIGQVNTQVISEPAQITEPHINIENVYFLSSNGWIEISKNGTAEREGGSYPKYNIRLKNTGTAPSSNIRILCMTPSTSSYITPYMDYIELPPGAFSLNVGEANTVSFDAPRPVVQGKLHSFQALHDGTVDSGFAFTIIAPVPAPEPVRGCTDPNALNYNPNATQDDGSCRYPENALFKIRNAFPVDISGTLLIPPLPKGTQFLMGITISNIGGTSGKFSLTSRHKDYSGNWSNWNYEHTQLNLAAGSAIDLCTEQKKLFTMPEQSKSFEFRVIPGLVVEGLPPDDTYAITIPTAKPAFFEIGDIMVFDESMKEVLSSSLEEGKKFYLIMSITNTGEVRDAITAIAYKIETGNGETPWHVSGTFGLLPGTTANKVFVTVPFSTEGAAVMPNDNIYFQIRTLSDPPNPAEFYDEKTYTVFEAANASFVGFISVDGTPVSRSGTVSISKKDVHTIFTIKNNGGIPQKLVISLIDDTGEIVYGPSETPELSPGGTASIEVVFKYNGGNKSYSLGVVP